MLLLVKRVRQWPFLLLAGCVVTLYFLDALGGAPFTALSATLDSPSRERLLKRQQTLWRSLYSRIQQDEPQCEPISHSLTEDLTISFNASDHDALRPSRISLSDTQRFKLRSAHRSFTTHLKQENYTLPFVQNTRGIVTTAGGKYLPVAVVSIRMLRITGCRLPVEVFLASQNEWDPQICDIVFPSMNTRCIVLEEIFNPSKENAMLAIVKYQYKIMSIVFSSFEEVLFIDSDCFPVSDPSDYFEIEPFQSSGMILWPDFWFPSESQAFFDIAEISAPRLDSRPASESGELFYSKTKHTNSLLLALYYNFYGPDFYYPLQAQGGSGQGDKETFLWSAIVFNESFYSVRKGVQALGYTTTDKEWRGSAMVQFDPVDDFTSRRQTTYSAERRPDAPIRPLFVHANFPKLNPGSIFQDVAFGATGPTKDADGTMRRIWHDDETKSIEFFGFDLERRLWRVMREIACAFEGTFSAWKGETGICENSTIYWNTLYENSDEGHV